MIRPTCRSRRRTPTFEAQLIHTDGSVRIVRSTGQAIETAEGLRDLFGVFQDVTEHRALTARLADSEARYARAVAASQDGL